MSRIKLLLDVVEDMRSLADSIQAVAQAMAENEPEPEATPTAAETPAPPKPTIPLETLRARLGEISRAGYTAAVHDLIQKHGATHLSKVDPKDYETLLEEAEALIHAT